MYIGGCGVGVVGSPKGSRVRVVIRKRKNLTTVETNQKSLSRKFGSRPESKK